jgi:hypothetical protein
MCKAIVVAQMASLEVDFSRKASLPKSDFCLRDKQCQLAQLANIFYLCQGGNGLHESAALRSEVEFARVVTPTARFRLE